MIKIKADKFQFKHCSGFSLMELMVAGALLAGVSLAAVKIFSDQRSTQKRIELDRVLDAHVSTIKSTLAIKANCNITMGIPFGTSAAPLTSFPSSLSSIKMIIGANTESNLISIGDSINDQNTHRLTAITLDPAPTTTGLLKIEMTYESRMFGSSVKRNVFIPVKVTGNQGTGNSYECMDDKMGVDKTLQKEGCEALVNLGDFEPDLQNCALRDLEFDSSGNYLCSNGETFVGLRNDGTADCQITDNRLNPNDAVGPAASSCAGKQVKLSVNASNQVVIECIP
ncbi:MAG: PulJ/GspJ family protein [Bacteriovoracaceae bacterium]